MAATLRAAMGGGGFRAVIALVLVAFFSCRISLQAAARCLLFACGRDRLIFGCEPLSRLSPKRHIAVGALAVNVLALSDGVPAITNMVWPGNPQDFWYSNYRMITTTLGVFGLGLVHMVAA